IVFAVGECLHAVVLQPLIAELAPPTLVGRYMALFGITFSVGLAAGPSASASALAVSPQLPWIAGAGAGFAARRPAAAPVDRGRGRDARAPAGALARRTSRAGAARPRLRDRVNVS